MVALIPTAVADGAAGRRLLIAGALLWLAAPAFTQSIRIPDFREERAAPVAGPRPGESCGNCGVVTSIREIRIERPIPLPGRPQSDSYERGIGSGVPIGAIVALPTGEGGTPYVGGVGTPEMQERFSSTSYAVTIQLDIGAETTLERRDGSRYRVGDRVRVRGTQLELLTP